MQEGSSYGGGDDRIYRLVCVWSVVSCYLQLVVEYLGPGPVM